MRTFIVVAILSCWPSFAIPFAFEQRSPNAFVTRPGAISVRHDRVVLGGVTLRFAGAAEATKVTGLGSSSPSTYIGADSARTFPAYSKVGIRGLYRGVDAVFYGSGDALEYDLHLAAGAAADRIRIMVEGAGSVRLDRTGNLLVDDGTHVIQQSRPRVFQGDAEIPASYAISKSGLIRIRLSNYNPRLPLRIDPVLAYTKSYGNAAIVRGMATDPQGNIYIAGMTNASDFPTTSNALRRTLTPPLVVLSNAGRTTSTLPVSTATNVGVVGGTKDGRILYVSTTDGIFLSGDAGATWRRTAPLPTQVSQFASRQLLVNAITVDALDPATVLVATSLGLFGSTSGGQSWFPRNTGLPVSASGNVSVSWVAYDPVNPLIVYAASVSPSYLFRSTDAGNTWRPLNPTYEGEPAPPTIPLPPVVAELSPDGRTLYVVNANGTFFRSADGGVSWTKLAQNAFFSSVKLQIDPTDPNTIYVQDGTGLKRSTDGGATFSTIVTAPNLRYFAVDSAGILYTADFNRISVSSDRGATVTPLPGANYSVNALSSLAGNLYAGTIVGSVPFVMKLDPTGSNVLYSTFVGSDASDYVNGLAVDSQGSVVLIGITNSPGFPLTVPGSITPAPGRTVAFVVKLNADGSNLIFSRTLGGAKPTYAQAVVADASGSVTVAGATFNTDFATTAGAYQQAIPATSCTRTQTSFFITPNTGTYGYVTKLSADGASLVYSTYLTGSCGSVAQSLAFDAAGNVLVGGYTTSPDFPVSPGSYQAEFPGRADQPSPPNTLNAGFVSKLSSAGDKLLASTYLGGGFSTQANAILVDQTGSTYITGSTQGFAKGATPGAIQPAFTDRCVPTLGIGPSPPYTGTSDGFVLKLDPDLTSARFMTYLGGGCNDAAASLALDATGNIWVSGTSVSPDFPLKDPFVIGGNYSSQTPGFVTELNPNASELLFSSFSDSALLASNRQGIFQTGTVGGSVTVSKIDPATTPPIHIDSVNLMSAFTSTILQNVAPGIAPGQFVELKGRNLGPATKVNAELDASGRLPFVLGGTSVRFGNIPAPLISVESTSIVCFAPFEITDPAQITVSSGGQRSNTARIGVTSSMPRILKIVNADGALNSADHPARLGTTIALFLSGLGITNPLSVDGLVNTDPLPSPVAQVTVYVPPAQITPAFVGAAPGMIAGITQVNVALPAALEGVTAGTTSISVNSAGAVLYVAQ